MRQMAENRLFWIVLPKFLANFYEAPSSTPPLDKIESPLGVPAGKGILFLACAVWAVPAQ